MGNCLRHGSSASSSMQWGGEDWSISARTYHNYDHKYCHKGIEMEEEEEGRLLGDNDSDNVKSSDFIASSTKAASSTTTELKIKITKKQLEELLSRAELKELSVQQVVAQLMNVSDRYETQQRSWRPALQSIPEVN